MLNLMRLEIKKFKLGGLLRGVIITNIVLIGVFVLMGAISVVEKEQLFRDAGEAVMFMEIIVLATFIIYGSVILDKLTVEEYKKRTIELMFMYPINRKRLFICKIIIVYLFTTISTLLSGFMTIVVVSAVERLVIDFVPGVIGLQAIKDNLLLICSSVIMSGFLAIAPLYFGMRKKSTVHTIVASVIIMSLTVSSGGEMSASLYLTRILVMGGIAVISIMLTLIRTLNDIDRVGME